MSLFKKKITEQDAAEAFVVSILKAATDNFPRTYEGLRELDKANFVIRNEGLAAIDLAVAAMALDIRVLRNLFSSDQAERVYSWIIQSTVKYLSPILNIDPLSTETYLKEEFELYDEAYCQQMEIHGITVRLLRLWLKKNSSYFIDERGYWNSVIIIFAIRYLIEFIGFWQNIRNNFQLISK